MVYRYLVLLSILAASSCIDSKDYDIDSVTLTPTVAVPLTYGEIGILDMLKDDDLTHLKVYPDGLLSFVYSKPFQSQDIKSLFKLPDNVVSTSFNLPAGTLPPISKDVRTDSVVLVVDLGLSPEQLSEVGLKAGSLDYVVNVTPANLNLGFEINMVLTDIVDKTTQVPLNVTTSAGTGSRSMQNQKAKLVKNKFNVKLVLILKKRATATIVPINSKVNVQLTFKSMDFSYLLGFFGEKTAIMAPQSFDIGIFGSSLSKAKISLVQPTVTLSVSNDFGVPCQIIFSTLEAQKSNATLPMQINPVSPANLNFPSVLGATASTTVSVVNATEIINFSPTKLVYSASARINRGQTGGNNFLTDTSKVRVSFGAEVPLYGKLSGISLYDTMKLDFQDVEASTVVLAALKVKSVNQMPLDANIQFFLADEKYQILDSIFTSNQTYLIKASSVTGTGDLDKPGTTNLDLTLSADKVNKLFSASYLIVRSKLNTTKDANGTLLNVKFRSTYKLKMNVGLMAKLNITLKK